MENTDRVWNLLAKKKAGEASAAELRELDLLMQQQELRGQTSEVIDKVWEAPIDVNPELRPGAKVWEKLEKQIAQPATHRLLSLQVWRRLAAASVLVLAGSAAVWFVQHKKTIQTEDIADKKPNQYTTQPGSKSKLELPDGTQVWLNGNSKLTFGNGPFGPVSREVYLSGEAFFDVAKNEKVPFIIHTGVIDITVLGTAFNVKAYPGEKNIETALVRGLIQITTHNDPDRKIILKPNEKLIIPTDTATAGTRITQAMSPSVYSITALNQGRSGILPDTIWMQRKLEFDDEPFSELAPKMEAWFDIRIRFGSESIRNKRFSGVIEKETLEETLKDLRLSSPFTYTLKGNDLLIK
jgi:ferric-dicitrate binding protein FerR (iron transport regulator)